MDDRAGDGPKAVTSRPAGGAGSMPSRGATGKRRRRQATTAPRRWRWLAFIGLSVLFVAASAGGLLFVRLLHGGISLAGIKPTIEQALADALPDKRVRYEAAELVLDDARRLVLNLTQVVISEADGRPLAQAPEIHGQISWPALKRGRLALGRIDVMSPRLAITMSDASAGAVDGSTASAVGATRAAAAADGGAGASSETVAVAVGDTSGPLDVVRVLTEASARARRREDASGYLRVVGLKQAVVVVGAGRHRTVWNVPDLQVDLAHRRASSAITAKATIATLAGPVVVVVETNETDKSDEVTLDVQAEGINPRGLARLLPGLGIAEGIDLPLSVKAQVVLATTGQVKSARGVAVSAGGDARGGLFGRQPVRIDAARVAFAYDGARDVIDLSEISLGWAGNALNLVGRLVADQQGGGWQYGLESTSGMLMAPRTAGQAFKIDVARATGRFATSPGRFLLQDMVVKVGGAEVSAKGDLQWSAQGASGQIDGRLSPTTFDVFRALWPSAVAPRVRDWVGEHVRKGRLAGGVFKAVIEPGVAAAGGRAQTVVRPSLTLEASGVEVQTVKGMPPVEIARGLVRVEGETVEITAPDFVLTAGEGRKLQFKAGRFTAVETAVGEQPTAEVAFRVSGPLAAVADLIDREPLLALKSNGISAGGIDGKIEGQVKALFPLADNLQYSEVRSEGRLRVSELRVKQAAGPHDISGGTINVEIGDKVIDVKGDVLIKGVTGKLAWQYQQNQPMAQQPPMRLATKLDNADRATLGLDVADLVQGETPVEVLVSFADGGQPQARVRVDLTQAELTFEPIAWRKAPGRTAIYQFDPVRGPGTGAAQRIELQNMKLVGDDIALEGWMAIGPDNKPREFSLPEFTLNVVSRLTVQGKRRMPDNVWDITAKGPTFDGRDIFRAMFNLGQTRPLVRKDKPGLDITAEIDTVLGFSDTTVKNVRLKASERAEKLTELDVKAMLSTGKPFAALIRNQPGIGRQLLAEGADAGQVFKVVGFYPNAIGGLMQLEVNLDGKGSSEKSGVLWSRDFAVLGDPVVSEVFQNIDDGTGQGSKGGKARQRVVRQKFDFEGLRVPFDVGSGQFVMNNAVIRGPVIGATFRGKIDFKQQAMNLGGTYVPLSGLNAAIGGLLGPLSGGPQGEGLFGITFAVQGSIAAPQVIVNPLSLLGPGIFREIFQMTPDTFRITPRQEGAAVAPATAPGRTRARVAPQRGSAARSSSAPATEGERSSDKARDGGEVLPDWSSEVRPSKKRAPVDAQR